MLTTKAIRRQLRDTYRLHGPCENGTVEILNASFIADEPSIFGKIDDGYMQRELDWYLSESLNINDITGKIPEIWKQVASKQGMINSNYGWCIYSQENERQFHRAIAALVKDRYSRQASMIYIRPTMHDDAFEDGCKDFMCTYATQLIIRDGKLHMMVFMRSNDAVFGYKNDRYWQNYVHEQAIRVLNQLGNPSLEKGNLYWNAASLHVYERHFKFLGE